MTELFTSEAITSAAKPINNEVPRPQVYYLVATWYCGPGCDGYWTIQKDKWTDRAAAERGVAKLPRGHTHYSILEIKLGQP